MTDEARAGEPRTKAGRALLATMRESAAGNPLLDRLVNDLGPLVLAIEREAAADATVECNQHVSDAWKTGWTEGRREAAAAPALDVPRLAVAVHDSTWACPTGQVVPNWCDPRSGELFHVSQAQSIAELYARLSESALEDMEVSEEKDHGGY